MEKNFLTPAETAEAVVQLNVKKANTPVKTTVLLGILAGIYISFGGITNILVTQTLGHIDVGLAKFFGGVVFPVGLMMVVICGAELFTGNNLMTLAVLDKKVNTKKLFRNWIIVWVSNFIGSLFIVLLVYLGDLFTGDAITKTISMAEAKTSLSFMTVFIRGIMCNIIVVLSVWMVNASKDITSKIFSCWFPILIFVIGGYEHCVANMFLLPMAMVFGGNITIASLIGNLIPATLGNIVGGGIIIPIIYYNCYIKPSRKLQAAE